jgi:Zn-dependent protease with chaperone function
MNFFEHQQQAREQTTKLVLLFLLAVLAILAAINIGMLLFWRWAQAGTPYPRGFFAVNTLLPLLLIIGGTLLEIFRLREGGEAVAKMAGGRLVAMQTPETHERRLLNVVQEMALAAGIACPKVYVLDREASINAFAAGYNPNEAVVAVTSGALQRLTRDELQGVIAHEFSHILNGDMRLNVRLIALLFGIQMVAGFGQHLIDIGSRMGASRTRSRDEKGPPLLLVLLALGAALFLAGYIGIFFGRLIKAAVSRQREFLADASAVQFTRNPDTIGGALRKIAGLDRDGGPGARIAHPNAEHLSHLFLGAVRPQLMAGWLATHPPLSERLRRIYGKSVIPLAAPELPADAPPQEAEQMLPDLAYAASGFTGNPAEAAFNGGVPAAESPWTSGAAPVTHDAGSTHDETVPLQLSGQLAQALYDPDMACALAYAVLLGDDAERVAQLTLLQAEAPKQAVHMRSLTQALSRMPKSVRLPLLDLAMPALRTLPPCGRAHFLLVVAHLIAADGHVSLTEFVIETVLERRLAAHAGRAVPVKFNRLAELGDDCAVLLSLVSHVAAAASGASALELYLRGSAAAPEAGLSVAGLADVAAMGFAPVRLALDRANQLAPLKKPALIKMLLAAANGRAHLPDTVADVLRAICAALDAPVPLLVLASYRDLNTNA